MQQQQYQNQFLNDKSPRITNIHIHLLHNNDLTASTLPSIQQHAITYQNQETFGLLLNFIFFFFFFLCFFLLAFYYFSFVSCRPFRCLFFFCYCRYKGNKNSTSAVEEQRNKRGKKAREKKTESNRREMLFCFHFCPPLLLLSFSTPTPFNY